MVNIENRWVELFKKLVNKKAREKIHGLFINKYFTKIGVSTYCLLTI
jgi:hypothetical protein